MSVAKQTIELIKNEQLEQAFELNKPLAYKIAQTYVARANRQGMAYEDVMQESLVALWGAVNNFIVEKGYYFSTFGTRVINNHLQAMLSRRKYKPIGGEDAVDYNTLEPTFANSSEKDIYNKVLSEQIIQKGTNLSKVEVNCLKYALQGFSNVEIGKKYKFTHQNASLKHLGAVKKLKASITGT